MARPELRASLVARFLGAVFGVYVLKALFFSGKASLPHANSQDSRADVDAQAHKADDAIAHVNVFERISMGLPLAGTQLDPQKYPFLQSRIGREADTTKDLFDLDIEAGVHDFWRRFQLPFVKSRETFHLDEQVIKSTVDELMSFNGWAAAGCGSLSRPFAGRREDSYADLNRPGRFFYFALIVHSADHFFVDQLAVIVQASRKLGTQHIFVSVLDYASSDSTPFLSDLAEAVLILLGVPFRIRRVDQMTEDPAASYYPSEEAYTRNLALEPLYELYERRKLVFTRVIWLKGFTCVNDLLETLRISLINSAAMVCSMDWKEHNGFFIYNDRWRTRDLDGNLFRGSKSTSSVDEAPPRHRASAARYNQHLPFQVFCCESGSHVVDPSQSYYSGIRYRSATRGVYNSSLSKPPDASVLENWTDGPCMDSSQMHFCRDLWLEEAKNGVKDSAREAFKRQRAGKARELGEDLEDIVRVVAPKLSIPGRSDPLRARPQTPSTPKKDAHRQGNVHLGASEEDSPQADFDKSDGVGAGRDVEAAERAKKLEAGEGAQGEEEKPKADVKVGGKPLQKHEGQPEAKLEKRAEDPPAEVKADEKEQVSDTLAAGTGADEDEEGDFDDADEHSDLPNSAFSPAKILVNPRCITTYAGVSHTKLALDLFGEGDDDVEPSSSEGGRYEVDEWKGAPHAFVCQEMRTTGGRISSKQQRRTGFHIADALRQGWKIGDDN